MRGFYIGLALVTAAILGYVGYVVADDYETKNTNEMECMQKGGKYVKSGKYDRICLRKDVVIELTNDD